MYTHMHTHSLETLERQQTSQRRVQDNKGTGSELGFLSPTVSGIQEPGTALKTTQRVVLLKSLSRLIEITETL